MTSRNLPSMIICNWMIVQKIVTLAASTIYVYYKKMIIRLQVSETTHQVGRMSISTPFDMPYKEMALHCEALLVGKQQKMSTFMGTNSIQGCSFRIPVPEYNKEKDTSSNANVQQTLPSVLLYLNQNLKFLISIVHFEIVCICG